jgi:cobalt-zinc-cadmium efflux system outer membrane protein
VAGTLHDQALQHRPEIVAADAGIARGKTLVELARKDHDPDVTLGLTYGLVGRRIDAAGRAMPPENDGRDVLGVTASVNLPIWRQKLAAGVEQSVEEELVAEEQRRSVAASIAETLGDLSERIPLTWERLRLLEDVLVVQAHEALRSAENAYSSGTATSLDLLDAERVLLQVRINTARTRADYAVAVARLEGATGVPITGEPKS